MDTKHKVISEFVPVSAVLRASRLLSHEHPPIPHSVQRAKKRIHGKPYTTCWLKPKVKCAEVVDARCLCTCYFLFLQEQIKDNIIMCAFRCVRR
jgi:hypothetical protein